MDVLHVDTDLGRLHAFLLMPIGTRGVPLVVGLHGGPRPPLDLEAAQRDARPWIQAGFAYLAADYRASEVLGAAESVRVLSGDDVPGPGDDSRDVQACFEALVALPIAGQLNLNAVVVYGFSYGACVVNRWVTWMGKAVGVQLVVCHEGVADLRTLDEANTLIQAQRRGSTPEQAPEHWSAASPVDRAEQVQLPMVLAYGGASPLREQGLAWRSAVEQASAPVYWHEARGEGHVYSDSALEDLTRYVGRYLRAAPMKSGGSR